VIRQDVTLNGVSLREVYPRVLSVRLIDEAAQQAVTYGDSPGRDGRRVLGARRESKRVRVEFYIRDLYDLPRRTAVIDTINAWAAPGGDLRWSGRPGQRLRVICASPARAEDAGDYTERISITYEANAAPYWEDAEPMPLTLTGASASGSLVVAGAARTPIEARVTPQAALTSLTLTAEAGGETTRISLTGLSVAAGTVIALAHDDQGTLAITAGGVSILPSRTGDSDDELIARPPVTRVTLTADAACTAAITARGRYL